jgi:hypothetical protein
MVPAVIEYESLTPRLLVSIHADLMAQRLPVGTIINTSTPAVAIDSACRMVQGALTSLESRLARYETLERQLRTTSR